MTSITTVAITARKSSPIAHVTLFRLVQLSASHPYVEKNLNKLFPVASYIVEPASRQAHVRRAKVAPTYARWLLQRYFHGFWIQSSKGRGLWVFSAAAHHAEERCSSGSAVSLRSKRQRRETVTLVQGRYLIFSPGFKITDRDLETARPLASSDR
jgi:hypothetical protein